MKIESQNIEWKEQWRDEYIKWVCGFANAHGGKIYIGIDDNGVVKGIENAEKYLEDIPNKIKDILGILVDVNLKTKSKLPYLEIVVEPYPCPISYKGQYFYRSGSTKQELKGPSLDKFLLRKQGVHWDGMAQPYATVGELSKSAFDDFRSKAKNSYRLPADVIKERSELLIEKLRLKTDSHHLKQAAILLFHRDPEKYITGAFVKIGYFSTDDDLIFQDEVHGYLFEQVDKTMDLLLTKYLKAIISYRGVNRMEQYQIPQAALREALINAIVHKDYSSKNPIQISVYDMKTIIWNEGQLPEDWTVEKLKSKHPSKPFNPDMANVFFRAGLIEAWGRGTIKIINECKKAKVPRPTFKYDLSGFLIEFTYKASKPLLQNATSTTTIPEQLMQLITNDNAITIAEMADEIDVAQRTITRALKHLQETNKIRRKGGKKGGFWEIMTQ